MNRALILTAVLGCAHGPSSGTPSHAPVSAYYPLAVGNSWTYDRSYLGDHADQQISIVKLEDGKFVDSTGNRLWVDAYGIRDEKRYLLEVPLESGHEWKSTVSVSSTERYKIIEAGQDCEAPAGKFEDCVRVESRNRQDAKTVLVNELTFAPKVGIVRIAVAVEASGKTIPQGELVLKSYKLAAK